MGCLIYSWRSQILNDHDGSGRSLDKREKNTVGSLGVGVTEAVKGRTWHSIVVDLMKR
jgi:coenzyme F420-reducing hydrogenase alpha subunit